MPGEPRDRIRRPPAGLVLPLLLGMLALAMVLAAARGQVSIPFHSAAGMILDRLGLLRGRPWWTPQEEEILFALRLPRVVGAALVGAALAAAGALFQGLLRNPLADPYVVGTSGGAALGAIAGILVGGSAVTLGFGWVPALAFIGALLAMGLVYRLAQVGGRIPVVTVLLAGFAVSTLLGYTGSLLIVLNDRLQLQRGELYARLLGGVSVTGWLQLAVIAPLVLGTTGASLGLARTLNALTLGEDAATRLGVPVEAHKRWILFAGSLLTAAAVSISGLIGFVGLIVPHTIRLLCGPDHRLLLPASALGGALFLVLADLLARTALPPADLPVGILTAFLGGPFFLWLLRQSRREYEW